MYDTVRAAMAAVVWLAASGCAFAGAAPADVTIASGALKGVVAGDVASFKAIPYAAPPVGDLRWRAPQPPAPWKGVRPADAFGPACIQTPGASAYAGPSERGLPHPERLDPGSPDGRQAAGDGLDPRRRLRGRHGRALRWRAFRQATAWSW